MLTSTKVLSKFFFQFYRKIGKLYGYLPFVLNSSTHQFVSGTKRLLIFSNFAIIFQMSIAAFSISMDNALIVGLQNINKTTEAVELITCLSFYGLIFATPLTAFFQRKQILKMLNNFLVLNRYCRALNGKVLLVATKHIRRLYVKLIFDVFSTLVLAGLMGLSTKQETIYGIFTFFYFLFSVPIDGFAANVLCSCFYYYGHLIEIVINEFGKQRENIVIQSENHGLRKIKGMDFNAEISVELDCLTEFYWSILDSSKKLVQILQYTLIVYLFSCFLGTVWAVRHKLLLNDDFLHRCFLIYRFRHYIPRCYVCLLAGFTC